MSLPPNFIDEIRNRTSITQVVGRRVMWDMRRSNQNRGDMWAPCPFHHEKTASFHVEESKGRYHCFGCKVSGDIFSFLQETDNMSFMEAVEELALQAGMTMPARDPLAAKKAEKQTELADVMEMAVQHYRLMLKTGAGAAARDYLAGRGLSAEAQDRFDIGYAPASRPGVFGYLREKGIQPEMIVATGVCAESDRGGQPYDRFFDRIIFPIRDARGRCISLGGRAMSPDAKAKYLNGPLTDIFDKGKSLYNHGPARRASRDHPIILAEGYMDVIALSEAGFPGAVAPLGTAVTPDQLQMLWAMSPEPIVALDGDSAGLESALRLIDLALPLLEAGRSLRFALLPARMDPDDLIKTRGADAMRQLLDSAQPMVRLLWQRETEGKSFDSPERKAALDARLGKVIGTIKDGTLRNHYFSEIKQLRWELFRSQGTRRGDRPAFRPRGAPEPATPSARQSSLATATQVRIEDHIREAVILATFITTPEVIEAFEGDLERLDMAHADHRALRDAILACVDVPTERFREALSEITGPDALEKLLSLRHVQIAPALRNPGNVTMARQCLREELAKLASTRGAEREIEEAVADIDALSPQDEGMAWRIRQAVNARDSAIRSVGEDTTEYEMAPNGLQLDRSERDALAELLDQISSKPDGESG